jgi:hypothetical protein
MKVGEILTKSKNRLASYGINYRQPFDTYYDLLLSDDEIRPVEIGSILVLTDNRPRSLIAIAYALRMAKGLEANLMAITTNVHQDLVKGEATNYDINLAFMKAFNKPPSLEYVLNVIQTQKVGLVILHNLYHLKEDLIESSPVPVLIIKVTQFFKSTS